MLRIATLTLFCILASMGEIRSGAQCRHEQGIQNYQEQAFYKKNTEQGMLSEPQWDKVVELSKAYFDPPYPYGFLESEFIKNWRLVETVGMSSEHPMAALMITVDGKGQRGHAFYANYQFIKQDALLESRLRKDDLKYYNRLLDIEGVSVTDPSRALGVCSLLLKVATHRERGFFIQVISSTSDIPSPSDDAKRFGAIVWKQEDAETLSQRQRKIETASRIVSVPQFSKSSDTYELSFFTWDPVNGDVERWCMRVTGNSITDVKRELIAARL